MSQQTQFRLNFNGISLELEGDRAFVDDMYRDIMRDIEEAKRRNTVREKKNAKRFDRVDRAVSSVAASIKEIKKNQLQSSQINDKITELKTLVENLADATRVRRGSTAHAA